MHKVYFLIGPPGIGKSTFRWTKLDPDGNCYVASTDDIFESYGKKLDMSYNEAFGFFKFEAVQNIFITKLKEAIANNQDIIIDRTNMSKKSRRHILELFPAHYKKVAVVFDFSDRERLNNQLKKRELEDGKRIPEEVIDKMISSYEEPTQEEFNTIMFIQK